jgi:hypothetical protein
MTAGTTGTFDRATGSLSRALAQRITRRSAVGRLGRYGVALTVGAAGISLLDPAEALASFPCGCGGCSPYGPSGRCNCDSRWCDDGGYCPSYACQCGAWSAGCSCNGGSGTMYYGDCCGSCGGGADCAVSSSYDCSGGPCGGGCSPCPGCCHQLEHYGDPNRNCGTCNCSNPWYVNCRRAICVT